MHVFQKKKCCTKVNLSFHSIFLWTLVCPGISTPTLEPGNQYGWYFCHKGPGASLGHSSNPFTTCKLFSVTAESLLTLSLFLTHWLCEFVPKQMSSSKMEWVHSTSGRCFIWAHWWLACCLFVVVDFILEDWFPFTKNLTAESTKNSCIAFPSCALHILHECRMCGAIDEAIRMHWFMRGFTLDRIPVFW